MGLDGGTIITRSDVLRGSSWALNTQDVGRSTRGGDAALGSKNVGGRVHAPLAAPAEAEVRWSTCSLSGEALSTEPKEIVACNMGRLYNMAAVLEHLLALGGVHVTEGSEYALANRAAAGQADEVSHITSRKDVFGVELREREGWGAAALVDEEGRGVRQMGRFVCPITDLPCERYPCSALRPCGHVFSDKALEGCRPGGAPGATALACPLCDTAYKDADVLRINGSKEEEEAAAEEILRKLAKKEAKKRDKKRRRDEGKGGGGDGGGGGGKSLKG